MSKNGEVTLVGAGPGDPALLTLAAKAAIDHADIVLHDRLISPDILSLIPSTVQRIDVGKNKGRHPVPQNEINNLIIRHAKEGKRVVRLKGGDPYLFGRGAEELEAVAHAGIPFRVIPGITSALAAPAYAGIPVTHRDYASSVHILTGHRKNGEPPNIPYHELVGLKGTLIFLMSLSAADEIKDGLLKAGMSPDTPAALVENGTRPNQRRLTASIATLPDRAREQGFSSPALMVVGDVCALAPTFDWTSRPPLRDKRILAVSSRESAGRLAAQLRERGCTVDEFAGIATQPLPVADTLWSSLKQYAWIVFSSQFGVECFFNAMKEKRLDARALAAARIAAVGRRTAQALERHGIFADYVPDEFNGRALGRGLAELAAGGDKILLYRAQAGGDDLPGELTRAGLDFDDVAAYMTTANPLPEEFAERVREGAYDAVTFTSASSVASFFEAAPKMEAAFPPACCIGETTAEAARAHGMTVFVSREATIDSLAELLLSEIAHFSRFH